MAHIKCNHSFSEQRPLLSRTNTSSSKDDRPSNTFSQTSNNSTHSVGGTRSSARTMPKYREHPTYGSMPIPIPKSTRLTSASSAYQNNLSGSSRFSDEELIESIARDAASAQAKSARSKLQEEGAALGLHVYMPPPEDKDSDLETLSEACGCGCEDSYQNPKQTTQVVVRGLRYSLPAQAPPRPQRQFDTRYWFLFAILLLVFTYYAVGVVKLKIDCPHGTTADPEVCGEGVHFCCVGGPETQTELPPLAVKAMDTLTPLADAGQRWWAEKWAA